MCICKDGDRLLSVYYARFLVFFRTRWLNGSTLGGVGHAIFRDASLLAYERTDRSM